MEYKAQPTLNILLRGKGGIGRFAPSPKIQNLSVGHISLGARILNLGRGSEATDASLPPENNTQINKHAIRLDGRRSRKEMETK